MLRTILLLTDETSLRDRLNKLITQWGFFVIPVFAPKDLPSFIQKCNPDIVLTDFSLLQNAPECVDNLEKQWREQALVTEFIYLDRADCPSSLAAGSRPEFLSGLASADDEEGLLQALTEIFDLMPLPKRRSGAELTQIFQMLQTPDGNPFLDFDLDSKVTTGLARACQLVEKPIDRLASMDRADFHFQTLAEAENVASAIAQVCPDPVMAGLGLRELMVNAIEHGNLGITHEEKTELVRNATWEREIEARLTEAHNLNKFVFVGFERKPDRILVDIRDQGKGFDWQFYMESIQQPSSKPHGRGISIATLIAFDRVEYKGRGNEVQVMIKC